MIGGCVIRNDGSLIDNDGSWSQRIFSFIAKPYFDLEHENVWDE